MRDPARIEKILGKLRHVWWETPDQRLGQLLYNLRGRGSGDTFYFEDDQLEAALDKRIQEIKTGSHG